MPAAILIIYRNDDNQSFLLSITQSEDVVCTDVIETGQCDQYFNRQLASSVFVVGIGTL